MPILLFSCWLLYSLSVQACTFKEKISVHSLSGPISVMLSKLDLLKSPQVKSISIFHPIPVGSFKGEVLPGGIFLARDTVEKFKGALVFYDEGIELKKIFSTYREIKSFEIKTRGLNPMEVSDLLVRSLLPFIIGCEEKIEALRKRQVALSKHLKEKISNGLTVVFFIGEIGRKLPPTIMANDGFVKWLVDEKVFKSYPSEMAYLNWSAKIMNSLPINTLKVGLIDSGKTMKMEVRKMSEGLNLTYPGILVPGISQIEGLIYLFENLK